MKRCQLLSLFFFVIGIVCFVIGAMAGDVTTGFVLVFPFVMGSGLYPLLGMVCIIIALLLFMIGGIQRVPDDQPSSHDKGQDVPMEKRVTGGGVVLIGPIPIIVGSNWKITLLLMLVALIIIVTTVLLLLVL